MKDKINVLIADDNQDFSHTLSAYINSQEVFCEEAAAAEKQEKETIGRIFIPMERPEE